jgi:Cdc6-like AAA superfamily ATPase
MNGSPSSQDVRLIHQNLIKVFFENENFARVHSIIEENIIDALAAREAGDLTETRGVAVLGCSGAGKTASVLQSLSQLGFERTKVGDRERPYLLVRLSANASLKGVSADCLAEIGWRARMQDSARSIWQEVTHYMRELNTFILVLDEIQQCPDDRSKRQSSLRTTN